MQVIDEKGRVFGVVNVIDLVVVLVLVAVAGAGLLLVVNGGGEMASPDQERVAVTLEAEGVQPYVANSLSADEDPLNDQVVGIENVSVRPATIVSVNDSGSVTTAEHPRLKTVTVEATVVVDENTNQGLQFEGQPLRVGGQFTLDTGTATIQGTVSEIDRESQ